jgi:hypothetical protein
MNTFGTIKTKIENASAEVYNTNQFKTFMKELKSHILENKDMSEIYYLYDDLSTNKGLNNDIAEDYVNESIEYLQVLIESNDKKINLIDRWVSNYTESKSNNYKDIDTTVYEKSIKSLNNVLESKNNIKSVIKTSPKTEIVKESVNLPLSSMVKIATTTFNKKYENISEEDKSKLKELISLSQDDVKEKIESLKEEINSKLNKSLNESTDTDLKNTLSKTIEKINSSKSDLYNLFKLQELNQGL